MPFERILDLFDRDVGRHIEEVIKVDQTSTDVVQQEIEEYVATDPIRKSFERILTRFQETPNNPHEGVGIWVSGFFGAGKSSFAKILGYVLEDRDLEDISAATLFGEQTADPRIQALLKTIKERIPTKSVIFDISTDQSVVDAEQKLTDVVYQVLLRELGYSTDREIAELEITLEHEDRLSAFLEGFERLYPDKDWDEVKEFSVVARSMASAVLHELDPGTYPEADSWARTPHKVDVTANRVAERAYELMRRRADGRALVFVVDEVGQYVARSTEKMLDLQGLIQALGRVGKNHAREWKGQVWLVVTSQERLSEVVDNLEGKDVELARLRDRFPIEVDLAPSDIREVTSERILKKRSDAVQELRSLFMGNRGKLGEATRLSGGSYGGELDQEGFVELYPFLPYQIDLVINIVSGLRTQGGGSRHVGGANRTIIKLAQQVLINEKTALGEEPVGRLVTLDVIYDLLEGLVNTERRQDLNEIRQAFGDDSLELRVAKALALLQFVKQLPRSPENLAALLHPSVDAGPRRSEVESALASLEEARRVRRTDEGWELLSKAGKDWQEEKRSLDGSPRRRQELIEGLVEQVLEDASGYRHKGLKTFKPQPVIHGRRVGRGGDIEIRMQLVPDEEGVESAEERARGDSNTSEGQDALHWVVTISEGVYRTIRELERTEEMVRRYEQETLSPEQSRLLGDEKASLQRQRATLVGMVRRQFKSGASFFRGVRTPLGQLGDDVRGVVSGALEDAVPKLYPKFDLVGVSVRSGDSVKILESDTLSALPPIYYAGKDGLELIRREGGDQRVDVQHDALQEVLGFIQERAQYEKEAQGKAIENRFTGFGYGWDIEAVMLLVATLFRAAEVEVYHGRRYTSYAETSVREVFRKTQIFRSASFKPRGTGIDLPKLTACAQALQELYGEQVPIEEGAIAGKVQERFPGELARCHRVVSVLQANGLPGVEGLQELVTELDGIRQGSAEDTVLSFHGQMASVKEGLSRLKKFEHAVDGENLEMLRRARRAKVELWSELRDVGRADEVEAPVSVLQSRLEDEGFPDHLPEIGKAARAVMDTHDAVEKELRAELEEALQGELDGVRNRREWEGLDEEAQSRVFAPFATVRRKVDHGVGRLPELVSDLKALPTLRNEAQAKLIEMSQPPGEEEPRVHRIRASRYAASGLRNEQDVEEMLDALGKACREAIARGETVVVE